MLCNNILKHNVDICYNLYNKEDYLDLVILKRHWIQQVIVLY
jgi:hypothetical protein